MTFTSEFWCCLDLSAVFKTMPSLSCTGIVLNFTCGKGGPLVGSSLRQGRDKSLELQCRGMPGIPPGGLAQVHFHSTAAHAEAGSHGEGLS